MCSLPSLRRVRPGVGQADQANAAVRWVGSTLQVAKVLQHADEFAHRLMCDAGSSGKVGQAAAVVVDVLETGWNAAWTAG